MSSKKSSEHPIERAESAIATEPLLAVDIALLAFGQTRGHRSTWETNHYYDVLGRAVCRASGLSSPPKGEGFRLMLNEPICHGLACAALLRLLALDEEALEGEGLRGTVPLFDRVAGTRLYGALSISKKSQTYEKTEALRGAMARSEAAIQEHIDSLSTLGALSAFQGELKRLLNDKVAQFAIAPFLPSQITSHTISELIASVQAVVGSPDSDLLEHAESAVEVCEHFRETAAALPTAYSTSMLVSLADKLLALVRVFIREKGLTDPASVDFAISEKHYPLHHVGSDIVLRLDITNSGKGLARDVVVSIEHDPVVAFQETVRFLDQLPPSSRRVDFPGSIVASSGDTAVEVRVTWKDPDGSEHENSRIEDLTASPHIVKCEELANENPYPLSPVSKVGLFVGRETILATLTKLVLGATPDNARIVGQRRVGKTSIVRTLEERLREQHPGTFIFIYVESGDFTANTAEKTIEALGSVIARRILKSDSRFSGITIPSFENGLAPLTEVIERAAELAPDKKLIIALDEFDVMPQPELYGRGPIATALFQTLRSLGGKENAGIIIIGGERMRFILADQGTPLNLFKHIPVGDFTEDQFDDYRALLVEPVKDWLHYDEPAVRLLFHETGGNPWITKHIAREIFQRAIANHDCDIRAEDVESAIIAVIPALGASSFQHYWEDAISGGESEQQFVSLTRRKVLLALGSCLRSAERVTEQDVVTTAQKYNVERNTAAEVLSGFRDRQILVDGLGVEARSPVFLRWLRDEGANEIIVSMGDDDVLIKRQRYLETLRPKPRELESMIERWRTYQGRLLTVDQVRSWLCQFGDPSNQRLMYAFLNGLRYFGSGEIRERLRELHNFALRDLAERGYTYTFRERQRSRDDLVVCALEGGGSGAAHLLQPYRDENKIFARCVVELPQVPSLVNEPGNHVRAVLILEDFIATGTNCKGRLREVTRKWTEGGDWPEGIDVYLLAITGFDTGVDAVARSVEDLLVPFRVHVAAALDDGDRCFHERSRIFTEPEDRERARSLCYDRGIDLEPKHPLGYNDSEAAVCFENRCPNNTLPVLWKDGTNWRALFPRMPR
jgi:hypothetical protein